MEVAAGHGSSDPWREPVTSDPLQSLATELILLRSNGLVFADELARDIRRSGMSATTPAGRWLPRIHPADTRVTGGQSRAGLLADHAAELRRRAATEGTPDQAVTVVVPRQLLLAKLDALEFWARALQRLDLPRHAYKRRVLDLVDQLVISLLGVPIDASGVMLSGLDLSDLDLVADVIWTEATLWPQAAREKILQRSRQIRPGVFQVRSAKPRRPAGTGRSRLVRDLRAEFARAKAPPPRRR